MEDDDGVDAVQRDGGSPLASDTSLAVRPDAEVSTKSAPPTPGVFAAHVLSDVHLEFLYSEDAEPGATEAQHGVFDFQPQAPYLVLAGDIGQPRLRAQWLWMLDRVSCMFHAVFIVSGNHEYYGMSVSETEQLQVELASQFDNVHYLQRDTVDLPGGLRVAGCTLWARIPPTAVDMMEYRVSDYRRIKVGDAGLQVKHTNAWNERDSAWIAQQKQKAVDDGVKLIVVTHHAPIKRNTLYHDLRDDEAMQTMAFSNQSALMGSPILLWLFGHTHHTSSQVVNGTIVASNQQGYLMHTNDYASQDECYDANLVFTAYADDEEQAKVVALVDQETRGHYESVDGGTCIMA